MRSREGLSSFAKQLRGVVRIPRGTRRTFRMTMTKRELVISVAMQLGMTQSDVAKIIESAFDAIAQALARGDRWELRDFGVFEVKTRASRIGRNPRTGEQVPVPERKVVNYRPGKKMKQIISGEHPDPIVHESEVPAVGDNP